MSAENKIAVFRSGDVDGLWAPVCSEAEWNYFRWLAFLFTTGKQLAVQKKLLIDRRLNIFQAQCAQKDLRYGRTSLILPEYEVPVLAASSPFQGVWLRPEELRFWLEKGVTFQGFNESIFSIAIREVWKDPLTMPEWYFEGCEAAAEALPDVELKDDLKGILKRRDDHWMLDALRLLLSNLEKVEVE